MLNKLKQMASLVNMPVWVILGSFVVLCLVLVKLIQVIYSRSHKKNKYSGVSIKDKSGNGKNLNRKKRTKKQQSIDIPSTQKDVSSAKGLTQSGNLQAISSALDIGRQSQSTKKTEKKKNRFSFIENSSVQLFINYNKHLVKVEVKLSALTIDNRPTLNELSPIPAIHSIAGIGDNSFKGKSKKKKIQDVETPTVSMVVSVDTQSLLDEGGEWQTVRSKEQKSTRRDKKRQESSDTPAVATSLPKPYQAVTLPQTFTSLPSTAKDVAPRFARAAREEWQAGANKRQFSSNVSKPNQLIVTRSPMAPASMLQASPKWLSNDENSWSAKTSDANITFPANTSAPWCQITSTNTEGLSWAQNVNAHKWSSKPTVTASPPWDEKDNPSAEPQSQWPSEPKTEDWVHVSAPSPTRVPTSEPWSSVPGVGTSHMAQWSDLGTLSQIKPSSMAEVTLKKRESFHMEPEGRSVSSLEPEDPWNIESFEKEGGDWSPPEASWCNPNEEWKVPSVPTKPEPTYFDESSEDEKPNTIISTAVVNTHTIVGAGSEFLSAQGQAANKKPRRRRRKKQAEGVSENVAKEDVVLPSSISASPVPDEEMKNPVAAEPVEETVAEEAWSVSKPGKKKKPRVRKDE